MDIKKTILAVDDTPENIDVLVGMLSSKYKVKVALNGEKALQVASKNPPDLILLDIMMPEMDGFEVCRRLKSNTETTNIPIIFVTAMSESVDEKKGFDVGGVDYITKPVNPSILQARVRTHLAMADQHRACELMVEVRTKELQKSQRAAIRMLGEAGHYNDSDTGVHIWRMAAYAGALARHSGWSVKDALRLELAAAMHDSGKIGISDAILKAPRKLTHNEFQEMKKHSSIGAKILSISSDTPIFQIAAVIAYGHHEKWDGSGYPQGLKGEEIPESARIAAVADVFDALTMKRPYKEPWSTNEAFATIEREAGTHFDPRLAACFLAIKDEILNLKEMWSQKE
ncbi:MAG: response regulator [Magnetococcales bacterium]|nr:response regulator [Magnetococcales bacterium]